MRYNPPPNWPVPPGWTPEPGWTPDPSWPPAPPGWQFWIDDSAAAWPPAPVPPRRSHTTRNVLIGVGAAVVVVVAVVIALVLLGVFGSTPKSNEDQIRAVVSDIQDGWNNSDYNAVVSHFCAKSRSNSSEDNFKDTRSKSGTIKFTISSIKVDGDNAKVDVTETYSKRTDTDTETLNFTKEDGKWTLCRSASE